MQKYRKRQPRTEIVEPIFGMGFDMGKDVEKAAFVGIGGRLEEWYREDFDREYERVEEEAKEQLVPCADCGFTTRLRHGVGDGKYYCDKCWESHWNKPLTLADLTPGDVFRLVSHDFCQAKHQLLSAEEFWCSRDRKSITITHSEREVVLIAHHDLTPKQLLWVGASDEERKALDESLRDKWLPRVNRQCQNIHNCALCVLARSKKWGCLDCIVGKAGDGCCAGHSTYRQWILYGVNGGTDRDGWTPGNAEEYRVTRDMALSLAMFKPNIDPTRIEVEATPEEWPGGK